MLQQDNSQGSSGSPMNESVLGEHVMLQDWLQKRSTSLQLVWKRRWCVLRDDRLFFYRSNTDTKPLGVLHLAEYSILASGPDISRKSKLAFRLSTSEPIPHQHQHHLFVTETAQSLQNWTYALQVHINHAAAAWASMAAASAGLGLQVTMERASSKSDRRGYGRGGLTGPQMTPEQSIIDKVLDRLQLEEPVGSSSSSSTIAAATALMGTGAYSESISSDTTTPATVSPPQQQLSNAPQFNLPYLSSNFPQSYEDNNDTWSSTSSIPNSSTNTSTNLDYIFALNQQHQQQQMLQNSQYLAKLSLDSLREHPLQQQQYSPQLQHSPVGIQSPAGQQPSQTGNYSGSSAGCPTESSCADQPSSLPEANRTSLQSVEYQGRTSLQQPRTYPSGHGFHAGSSINSFVHQHPQSPRAYPIRSSVHSNVSVDNSVPSPATSAAGSPFASPVLTSQPQTTMFHSNSQGSSSAVAQSPRTFYRVLESASAGKQAESVGSSTSISTIASSGDVSTINDLTSDNGPGASAVESSQTGKSGNTSHGVKLLGLMTGGKRRKDKERGTHSSASSSHSGSGSGGSPALKLFGSGLCSFSGCTQQSKTCIYHNKKARAEKNMKDKGSSSVSGKDKVGLDQKLGPGSDRNASQGNVSTATSTSPLFSSDGSPSLSLSGFKPGGGSGGRLASKSMTSLSRDNELSVDATPVPLPPNHLLSLVSSPVRRRSPSVSVMDDALVTTQQHAQQVYHSASIPPQPALSIDARDRTPPPPTQPLPPPPPRIVSSVSDPPPNGKESLSLSRKMGLQIGGDFGALDKGSLAGTALDGNFFVANHHRTMQKLQAKQTWKTPPQNISGPLPSIPGKSWPTHLQTQGGQQAQPSHPQQQQTRLYNGGVSRHIIAPDELAHAIEQEAEEMRRRQAEQKETQKNRPTSMIKSSFQSLPIHLALSTVSETSSMEGGTSSSVGSQVTSPTEHAEEGQRIISSQEQLACTPCPSDDPLLTAVESQRSPISGILSASSPLSHPQSPGLSLPLPVSIMAHSHTDSNTPTSGSERSASSIGSPYSNPASVASSVSSPLLRRRSLLATPPTPTAASSSNAQQMSVRHSVSPLASSFEAEKQDFLTTSLPPPKRHGNDHTSPLHGPSGLYSNNSGSLPHRSDRKGLPRRSSAAAVITTSSFLIGSSSAGQDEDGGGTGNAGVSSTSAASADFRPSYLVRRQSSSPVMIRLSEQGGQNISPLLSNGTTRTFVGDQPSGEVRRPGLTPISSPSGSSFSTSTACSSLCSFVTSRYIGHHPESGPHSHLEDLQMSSIQSTPLMSPLTETPSPSSTVLTVPRTKSFKDVSSPLVEATSIEGNSPAHSPMSSHMDHPAATTIEAAMVQGKHQTADTARPTKDSFATTPENDSVVPSVVVNSPRSSLSGQETMRQAPPPPSSPRRMVLHTAQSFVFPAPTSRASGVGSKTHDGTTGGRPLSTCSSVDGGHSCTASSEGSSSPLHSEHEQEDDYEEDEGEERARMQQRRRPRRYHSQSRASEHGSSHGGSPVISPSIHAAALELYPGLRKLSLFTAAYNGIPPPPLMLGSGQNSRKGSAGSASAREREDRDSQFTSTEDETESVDLQHDEDWAGNLKSIRKLKEPVGSSYWGYHGQRRTSLPGAPSPLQYQARMGSPTLSPSASPVPTEAPTSDSPPSPPQSSSQYGTPAPLPPLPPSYSASPASASLVLPESTSLPMQSAASGQNTVAATDAGAGAGAGAGTQSIPSSPASSAPPALPRRSPHRSAPVSPTTLRSPRSYQQLPSVPRDAS
ncbi:hypothetical protein EDD11_002628 [Mortierella claussenii]|nr:hypothetical protein EDD11_002628 [Mortierella claussenii]